MEHTFGHIDCPACNDENVPLYQSTAAHLVFPAAFKIWVARRTLKRTIGAPHIPDARYLSNRTLRDYQVCAGALGKFFGQLKLCQIHPGHIHEYQRARAVCDGAWTKPCGANRIRKEIALLLRILKATHLWGEQEEEDSSLCSL